MKIKTISFKGHPILGDASFDFAKPDGTIYSKIVLIGLNGSGKTTFLNSINDWIDAKKCSFSYAEYLNDNSELIKAEPLLGSVEYHYKITKNAETKNLRYLAMNIDNMRNNPDDIRHHGCIYSRASTNFKTNRINSITSSSIDVDVLDDENYDFTKVKQLLIDLNTEDNENLSKLLKNKTIQGYGEFIDKYSKISVFRNAINSFFEDIQYYGVSTENGQKDIKFVKNGKQISIDDLSTGEKQIVFRGVYILKNLNIRREGFVLIDEPEISMHPNWDSKLFSYYNNLLFSPGKKIGQLFIATHSERILKEALSDGDTLIVRLEPNPTGVVPTTITNSILLPYVSIAETVFVVFGTYSTDLHLQLYDYIMSSRGNNKVSDTDTYIKNHPSYNPSIHRRLTNYNSISYETISTSIRNNLHHGRPNNVSDTDLKISIDLLYGIVKNLI